MAIVLDVAVIFLLAFFFVMLSAIWNCLLGLFQRLLLECKQQAGILPVSACVLAPSTVPGT